MAEEKLLAFGKMSQNVENLILEHLRHIRSDLDGMKEDLREIKSRLTSLESAMAGLKRDNAGLYGDMAERVERIERQLDLQDET